MEILDTLYQDGVIDCFTVVLSGRHPMTGSYTSLAADYDARVFSQCTEGKYDPNSSNEHVDRSVGSIGTPLREHVMRRLAE